MVCLQFRSWRPISSRGVLTSSGLGRGEVPDALVVSPGGEQAAVVGDEPLVLVAPERSRHGVDEEGVERGTFDELDDGLVESR
jgi:hypothetical protein